MADKRPRIHVRPETPLRAPLTPQEWKRVAELLKLSPQQVRIVGAILAGMKDKQIARALGLSVPTVRTHLGRIFARLGVADRVELILRVFTEFRRLESRHRGRRQ